LPRRSDELIGEILATQAILQRASDREQALRASIELAYGLLWRITINMQSRPGWLTYQARQALLAQLDRDGQARGITAARLLEESRNNPRTAGTMTLIPREDRGNPPRE
jgi:hypothetical protein